MKLSKLIECANKRLKDYGDGDVKFLGENMPEPGSTDNITVVLYRNKK